MSAPSKNDSPAALVIRIKVRQGAGAEFSSWHAKATTAAAGLSGFISAEVNAPTPLGPPEWNIIQHFRTVAELGGWCATERHRLLLGEAKLLVDQGDAFYAAMNWWLFPREDNRRWIDPAGLALLIALYAIEIAVFSRLL